MVMENTFLIGWQACDFDKGKRMFSIWYLVNLAKNGCKVTNIVRSNFTALFSCYFLCYLSSRCERLPCEQNSECQSLPLRISFYNLIFPINIPIPAGVFRMGPSSSVPGDDIQIFIMDGDAERFFSIQKTATGGVVSVHIPLQEPRDFLLTMEIRLIRYSITSISVAKIAVFVINDQPI